MGVTGGHPLRPMRPTAPSAPAAPSQARWNPGPGRRRHAPALLVWIMAYGVAAGGRELMARGSGRAGQEAQWVPHGVEHAYRYGDSVSLCGESFPG